MTSNVTTTNVSGIEETARSTGRSLGLTAPPVFPAGIALRMDAVIRSVTTLLASLTALNARKHQQPPASMTDTVQTIMVTTSVTRVVTMRLVAGTAWTVRLTFQPIWQMAHWLSWSGFSPRNSLET